MKINKILVICHDAGGAEIISAYVKAHGKDNFVCYAAGPAKKIFKRKHINFKSLPSMTPSSKISEILSKNSGIRFILSGTSWASLIEIGFIQQAKSSGIKTVAYLDHWVNYRERFGYPKKNWQQNLPDEIWVGDQPALKIAKKSFGRIPCKLVPNLYFREVKQQYKKIKNKIHGPSNKIVFFSEPVRPGIDCFSEKKILQFTEFDILNQLLSFFAKKKIKNKIIISYHPSEKKGKYNKILSRYADKLKIIESGSQNALKNLAQTSLVVGIQSMVLVLAYLCRKRVVSFIPNKDIICPLPYGEIIKIKKAEELNKII